MNKGRIVQITIGSIVIIGLLMASLFVIEISKSNQKEFLKGLSTIEEPFLNLTSSVNQNFTRKARTKNYTIQGTMKVKLDGYQGQELAEKIEQGTEIAVDGRIKGFDKQSEITYTWKKGDTEVMQVNLLRDGQKIALGASEIANAYVAVENNNLQGLLTNLDKPAPYEIGQIEENSLIDFFVFEEVEKEALQEYGSVLSEKTKKENYKKVKQVFMIGGKQRQVTGYGVTLEKDEVRKLAIFLCQAMQEDSITLNLFSKRMKTLGFSEEEASINTIHGKLETIKQNLQNESTPLENLTIVYYPWKKQCLQLEVNYADQGFILYQEPKTNRVEFTWKSQDTSGKVSKMGNQTTLQMSKQGEEWEMVQEAEEKETGINRVMDISAKDATGTINIHYIEEKKFQDEVGEIERLTNENSVTLNEYPKAELKVLLQALQTQGKLIYQMKCEQLLQSL